MKGKWNILTGILLGAMVTWMIVSVLIISHQNNQLKTQRQAQQNQTEFQSEVLTSIRMSSYVALMGNILNKVDDELKVSPSRTLSDRTIARIAALNHALLPYRDFKNDSLTDKKFSPEKGQLLLALSLMDMDSSSFHKIKQQTPFFGANLSGANLSHINLQGINLRWANLSGANLDQTDLRRADLRDAVLWNTNLPGAQLDSADIQRADLSWANLNGAYLKGTNFNGANFTSAKLKKADIRGASGVLANFSSAFLNDADLTDTHLEVADFRKTNFNKANLSGVYIKQANMTHSVLTGTIMEGIRFENTILTHAEVDSQNWFEQLRDWKAIGLDQVQAEFNIVQDKSNPSLYRVEKIKD